MTVPQPLSEPPKSGSQDAEIPDAVASVAAQTDAADGFAADESQKDEATAAVNPVTDEPSAEPLKAAAQLDQKDHFPGLFLHGLWRDLLAGLGFFTRLPLRVPDIPLAQAAGAFPIIGALIGLGATFIYIFGLWVGFSSLMSAVLAVAATALLTGALHEDGLADFADMLGVRGDRDRKLAVMRGSTIGSYGTLALVFISLMKVAALAELAVPGQVAGALISAHALGRGMLPIVMRTYPLARGNGLAVHAGKPSVSSMYIALAVGALIAALVGGPGAASVSLGSALVVSFVIAHLAYRQIGGYTGDVLGAAEQLVEVTVMMNFVSFT